MKINVKKFIEFSYGDKRRDKAKVISIIDEMKEKYDPAKDRYKQFREAMASFEDKKINREEFLNLHKNVSNNKSIGYQLLAKNYLDLKEDYGLVWEGRVPIEVDISGLVITTAWYLRTEENNQRRIIYLHFGKDSFPREKERGILTVLRLASIDAVGVGILNIQPGTLTMSTRLDEKEAAFLRQRAARFVEISKKIDLSK
ncbi:hypothetical protein ACRC7T_03325 [Segnochrobactraceae bacterium EtOH-i3]